MARFGIRILGQYPVAPSSPGPFALLLRLSLESQFNLHENANYQGIGLGLSSEMQPMVHTQCVFKCLAREQRFFCWQNSGRPRFGSVTVRGWNGSSGSGFRFLENLCKKGFSVCFQYSLTGKDGAGSGFGSWKAVPAVPVPLSVSAKTRK